MVNTSLDKVFFSISPETFHSKIHLKYVDYKFIYSFTSFNFFIGIKHQLFSSTISSLAFMKNLIQQLN